ncbi:hypothetical protein PVA19_14470 [Agrobacterium sp. CNPSo 3708]|uniref:hypothetical protein n=1 Tax=unclassified Agrobacterium TaxID=2632611 RepID=UPI002363C560|nr:hypothetical protein [Agrobacterium sp. CNPSo 3708]MDD1499625.1 hypothetical protein [Agrobacterium sp. CNPSo 3708]
MATRVEITVFAMLQRKLCPLEGSLAVLGGRVGLKVAQLAGSLGHFAKSFAKRLHAPTHLRTKIILRGLHRQWLLEDWPRGNAALINRHGSLAKILSDRNLSHGSLHKKGAPKNAW